MVVLEGVMEIAVRLVMGLVKMAVMVVNILVLVLVKMLVQVVVIRVIVHVKMDVSVLTDNKL